MENLTIEKIKEILRGPLPGWEAQKIMAPAYREEEMAEAQRRFGSARLSAVMVLLVEKDGDVFIPFIERARYQGIHSGQISLPGGQTDDNDADAEATARRETEEEIGVGRHKPALIGELSTLYIPPSNFLVKPFVAYVKGDVNYKIDIQEVQRVVEIPLKDFFRKDAVKEKCFESSTAGKQKEAPYFDVGGLEIWGATAMIISEFIFMIKEFNI